MDKIAGLKVKNLSDMAATAFLVVMVVATFFFEVLIVLPHIHTIDVTVNYFHISAGLFIVFNIFTNVFWLITTDTSTAGHLLPSVLKPEWRFCASCEANAPPRSFHCFNCNKCILKRDHHCVFSGCCIGYKNYRYYIGLLVYVGIGGLYATVLNQFFIWQALGGLSWVAVLNHLLPFPFWLFGRIPFNVMVWTFIAIIDLCGFLFALSLLYYHTMLLINNQTTYEKNKSIKKYNLGNWKINLEESLGPNWLLAMFLAPVSSHLPRNGIDFPSAEDKSNLRKSK